LRWINEITIVMRAVMSPVVAISTRSGDMLYPVAHPLGR
jgi:hypothetical protein